MGRNNSKLRRQVRFDEAVKRQEIYKNLSDEEKQLRQDLYRKLNDTEKKKLHPSQS